MPHGTLQYLFHTPTIPSTAWAALLSAQLPPLPLLLAINLHSNMAVLLHGIFCPTIQHNMGIHPATGTTIVLLGEVSKLGHLPQVVKVPVEAFADEAV